MERSEIAGGSGAELVAFVLLTFALSWTVWLWPVLELPGGSSTDLFRLLGAFGPSIAALVLTAATGGVASVRELVGRLARVRVPVRWYGVALGLPLAVSVLATGLSVAAGEAVPDFTTPPVYELYPLPPPLAETELVVLFPAIFVQTLLFSSPMGEELGWRGYALPRLQARGTALRASVVLGVVWATWHLPLLLTPGDPLASEPFLGWVTGIVAYTVLFTWVFNNTGGSLFLALLFHTAIAVTGLFVSSVEVVPVLDDLLTVAIALLVLYRYGPRTLTREPRRSATTG